MANRKTIKVVYRKMGREKNWGLSDTCDNSIEIDERATGKKHLEILTHEAMHLLFPELSEEEVIKKSITLTNLLWKECYRRIDNTNKIPLQDGKK